ncbi:hypothetical protein ACFY9N_00245 [Microbacterium sp. NPDC008134]|uniref:hypothetical protein n=1 Tax=Microbacterium sp. NPDC008134 TaxID=3364183 RepID=UPI0036EB6D2A
MLRLRRDRYAHPGVAADIAEAVRIGGRLSCLSLLVAIGIFVHRSSGLHVQLAPDASRVRTPGSARTRLHWSAPSLVAAPLHAAAFEDVVRHAVRCQTPRAALATLDSLIHHGLLTQGQLVDVFGGLPQRYARLLALVDAAAESGPETFMRLILKAMGVRYETQVRIEGVGRVDFVIDGWLIIECDSREFHEGWHAQVEDRRRDLAAAARGFVTIRPLAADFMDRPDVVRAAVMDVLVALGSRGKCGRRS